jgi:hypothetical protein
VRDTETTITTTPSERSLEPRLRGALIAVVGFGVTATGIALATEGARVAAGLAAGAAMAALNLWGFARLGQKLIEGDEMPARFAAFGALKLGALFGGFYMLLKYQIVAPLPLMIGYGALPVGITFGVLFSGPARDDSTN